MAMVASPSPAASPAIPPASTTPPPRFHVLAVDDSVLDRKLIERLLRTSSYHVTAVESVSKALEFLGMQQPEGGPAATPSCSSTSTSSSSYYFRQQEISLIITDYSMPGMTGYDLLKTVKGSGSPVRDIPVVIMSSENVPARINRCLEEGADEFFLKPVKLSDMSKLRPHILRGKPTPTKDDQEVVTCGNSQLQSRVQQERTQLEVGQQQQLLLPPEQISGDAGAANDSPRSNKRKVAQGAGDSLQDQRTRTNYPRYDVCI